MRHGTERLMTSLQHIMRLHAVLAGDETDATAALVLVLLAGWFSWCGL
jgi:hypothetical protein